MFQIIDGSFFVPYASCLSKARLYCLSVWNDVKDLSAFFQHCVTALLAESECKGKANFETDKQIKKFFC